MSSGRILYFFVILNENEESMFSNYSCYLYLGDSDKGYNKDVICENCVKKQDFTLTNQIIQHIIIKNLTEQSDKSYEQK